MQVVAERAKSVRNRKPGILKDGGITESDVVIDREGITGICTYTDAGISVGYHSAIDRSLG